MASETTGRRSRARVSDVAVAAGVSPTTVSHALSGARAVNAETRERILAIARELGYVPDRVASGLRRRRTGVIGLIGDDLAATPFAGRIIEGARRAGLDRDVLLMVGESGGDADAERDLVARFLAQRVDGLLIARMYHQRVDRPEIPDDLPVVLVDAAPEPGWNVDAVVPDEAQIATLACERLTRDGHRDIAYVGTVDESRAARGRLIGIRSALGDAGIPLRDERVAFCTSNAVGGRQAGGELLDRDDRPTAIICFNDQMAMGVMQAAARRGIPVPTGLSIVGIDDLHPVADALDPGLTTVALPHAEMGRWAMERLLERIDGTPPPAVEGLHLLRGWLVERESVAPPFRDR
ncbi:LacI family DNA-binding transcriptional regulator [Microbacterium allomyrinae]|uniref:LacI family DNA-binding transcriptional regulator n=1 Tax=Microbacterium allomyrinae TaxID=2830666 RepID=A0A9X1LTD2_9MICO|nr:LacI family DNA-binding transcriptional regulator [Microbacterium allomyrinae]MCC2031600.1 LacI family DNA-binding transcriptional regulator [Microbacterium allomyrinae]